MKRFLFISLLALAAVSCEIPFDLDQQSKPMIYVQCIAGDSLIRLSPYYANPIVQSADGTAKTLQNLRMDVRVNGNGVDMQAVPGEERYAGEGFGAGDRLSIRLEAEGLPVVSGETTIPETPVVTSLNWKTIQVDTTQAIEVCMTLDHAPEEGEYYGIRINCHQTVVYLDGHSEEWDIPLTPGYILTQAESANFDLEDFMQLQYDGKNLGAPVYSPLTLVTKKQFTGAEYKFYLESYDAAMLDAIRNGLPNGETGMAGGGIVTGETGSGGPEEHIPGPDEIPLSIGELYTFVFSRLSEDFFLYAKALYQSNFDFLANMGLIPANFTWSNLSGGLGFVGAIRSTSLGPVELESPIVLPI